MLEQDGHIFDKNDVQNDFPNKYVVFRRKLTKPNFQFQYSIEIILKMIPKK